MDPCPKCITLEARLDLARQDIERVADERDRARELVADLRVELRHAYRESGHRRDDNIALTAERDALRDELQRAKFHADEFHQGDETMEQIVLSMWDCIDKKNVERDRAREALRAVLPACRLDDPCERDAVRAARAALEGEP